jgi:hypothetical protein
VKSELRIGVVEGAIVIEVWYGGQSIASVQGVDGPGVRIVSTHRLSVDANLRAVTVQVNH